MSAIFQDCNSCVQPEGRVFVRTRLLIIIHVAQNARFYTVTVKAGWVFMCSCCVFMRTKLTSGVMEAKCTTKPVARPLARKGSGILKPFYMR